MSALKDGLRFLVTKDGAMILDVAADELTTLNDAGGYVWALLKEGKSVEEIVDALEKSTGHNRSVIASDVQEFIEQLTARHLVTP